MTKFLFLLFCSALVSQLFLLIPRSFLTYHLSTSLSIILFPTPSDIVFSRLFGQTFAFLRQKDGRSVCSCFLFLSLITALFLSQSLPFSPGQLLFLTSLFRFPFLPLTLHPLYPFLHHFLKLFPSPEFSIFPSIFSHYFLTSLGNNSILLFQARQL